MNRTTGTIIIGQGLAGSLLAWQLTECGEDILIISDESAHNSSRVAAGLFNPVTGQRFVLQPQAELIIPTAMNFYQQLEEKFQQQFFHHVPMLRVINSEKEKETIGKRSENPCYRAYLGDILDTPQQIHGSLGAVSQLQTGYLDTSMLLNAIKSYFSHRQQYLNCALNHKEIELTANAVIWNGISAERIIFCEGYMAISNPWFKHLPFQPAKGEILHLKVNERLPEKIINAGKWLLPLQDGSYKTGATYHHDLSNIKPTETARDELTNGIEQMFRQQLAYEIIDHQAGVRPNTVDKSPFLGFHPDHHQVGIFNGFGSKGSMLIPYYSKVFSSHIIDGKPIPEEADIRRIKHD